MREFEETGARTTKDFIITCEQVRTEPSWSDRELNISVQQAFLYIHIVISFPFHVPPP